MVLRRFFQYPLIILSDFSMSPNQLLWISKGSTTPLHTPRNKIHPSKSHHFHFNTHTLPLSELSISGVHLASSEWWSWLYNDIVTDKKCKAIPISHNGVERLEVLESKPSVELNSVPSMTSVPVYCRQVLYDNHCNSAAEEFPVIRSFTTGAMHRVIKRGCFEAQTVIYVREWVYIVVNSG